MTLHIVFDTSVLRLPKHQLLDSSEIEGIKKLAMDGRVKIHFPYIVEYEFKSQRENYYKNIVADLFKAIGNLYADGKGVGGGLHNRLLSLENEKDKIIEEKVSYIDKWINETNSNRCAIECEDATKVFEKYFKGSRPFSGVKKRDDIPDAFIFQAILNISGKISESEQLVAIVEDKAIKNACIKESIKFYSNLEEFIRSDEHREMYKDHCLGKNMHNIQNIIIKYLDELDIDDIFNNAISDKSIVSAMLDQLKIIYPQLINIVINKLISQKFVIVKNIIYIGSNIFAVFFNSKVGVTYFDLEKDSADNVYSDIMNVSGRINISIDLEQLEEHCEGDIDVGIVNANVEFSDLSVDSLKMLEKKSFEDEAQGSKYIQADIESIDGVDDEEEAISYYVLNTNIRNNPDDHERMLKEGVAAAFYEPWKFYIEQLNKGDVVFLYQSGIGIVACGSASGKLKSREYDEIEDNEYYMALDGFCKLRYPISASEMKIIANRNFNFMRTMFKINPQSGELILKVSKENCI